MDRRDDSQYPIANQGVTYNNSASAVDDVQLRADDFGYATVDDMLDYVNPDVIPIGLDENKAQTNIPEQQRLVGVYRPIPTGVSGSVVTGKFELLGYELHNTSTSATAQVNVIDGFDTQYPAVFHITLAANESIREWFTQGIVFKYGCFISLVSGNVEGNIFTQELR